MTVVEINSVNYGSTGNIMLNIARDASDKDIMVFSAVPYSRSNRKKAVENEIFIGDRISRNVHSRLAYLTGGSGYFSVISTFRFLRVLKRLRPNIIHIHNLHGSYINIGMLFAFIKRNNIRVIWTLHDCWAFTGHCPHFTMVGCDKWRSGCYACPQFRYYPKSLIDNSKRMYNIKKKWFTGVPDMTIVTPSEWLAGLVRQSFLKDYPVKVINNGIDLSVFKPTESSWREEMGLEGKKIVLGVAFGWGQRKGLDVFVELAQRLDDSYRIVLVGTNENVDRELPDNVISIHRTHDQAELARIYSAADVFVNPTREENYPTVNMEALACGTPVITFKTGGSPEIIDETCGIVVDCDDVDALTDGIKKICEEHILNSEACIARAESFDMNERFLDYIALYQ